jgi:hypothetical protein
MKRSRLSEDLRHVVFDPFVMRPVLRTWYALGGGTPSGKMRRLLKGKMPPGVLPQMDPLLSCQMLECLPHAMPAAGLSDHALEMFYDFLLCARVPAHLCVDEAMTALGASGHVSVFVQLSNMALSHGSHAPRFVAVGVLAMADPPESLLDKSLHQLSFRLSFPPRYAYDSVKLPEVLAISRQVNEEFPLFQQLVSRRGPVCGQTTLQQVRGIRRHLIEVLAAPLFLRRPGFPPPHAEALQDAIAWCDSCLRRAQLRAEVLCRSPSPVALPVL